MFRNQKVTGLEASHGYCYVLLYNLQILVLSGKGGVGKSTFTSHLAHALGASDDRQVCSYYLLEEKYFM